MTEIWLHLHLEKKTFQRKFAFSRGLTSVRKRWSALERISSKLEGTIQVHYTSRETFSCCISGSDARNVGLIMALKNHSHFNGSVTFKYYKCAVAFFFFRDSWHSFILYNIAHGSRNEGPSDWPVASSATLIIAHVVYMDFYRACCPGHNVW